MNCLLNLNSPILYIALFLLPEDCPRAQGHTNTVSIIRKEFEDIRRNKQNLSPDSKLQQDIPHEKDAHLSQYIPHSYKALCMYNPYNVIHILSQS